MQIQEALDGFVLQLQANGRSAYTIDQYGRHVRALALWLAAERLALDVAEIDHRTVARFMASPAALRRPDGRTKLPTSTNALRTSLRVFFAFVRDAGYAQENAARLVRRARCSPPPPKSLTEDEAKRLLAAVESVSGRTAERDHAIVSLLLGTGLRIGSALALDVEDIDLENGEVRVREAKGGVRGTVFLNPAVRRSLARYLEGRETGALFPGLHGGRLDRRQVQVRLAQWFKRAGIQRKGSPHMLRHSFATALLARTGDLALVQRALLHRSLAATLVYVEVADSRLRAAVGA